MTCRRAATTPGMCSSELPQPAQTAGSWRRTRSGWDVIGNEAPALPACLPCGLPEDCRSERSREAGLVNPSLLGGFEEFFEFLSTLERNTAFSCSSRSTRFSNRAIVA